MALLTCPECGNQVSDKAEICPTCGYATADIILQTNEIKKKKSQIRNRKRIFIAGIVIIVIVTILIIVSIILKPDTSGYYNGIKWDTSFEILKQQITGKNVIVDEEDKEISETVENFNKLEDVLGWVHYNFEDEKLCEISIMILINEDKTNMTYVELEKKLSDNLTELYGKSEKEGTSTKIWETENSVISIWLYKGMLTLTYTDINYKDK